MKYYSEANAQMISSREERKGKLKLRKTVTVAPQCQDGFHASEKLTVLDDMLENPAKVFLNYIGDREYLSSIGIKTSDVIVDDPCIELSGISGKPIGCDTEVLPDDIEVFSRGADRTEELSGIYTGVSFLLTIDKPGPYTLISGANIPKVEIDGLTVKVRGSAVFTMDKFKRYFMTAFLVNGSWIDGYGRIKPATYTILVIGNKIISVSIIANATATHANIGVYSSGLRMYGVTIHKFHDGSTGVPGKLTHPRTWNPYWGNNMSTFDQVYERCGSILDYSCKTLKRITGGCK